MSKRAWGSILALTLAMAGFGRTLPPAYAQPATLPPYGVQVNDPEHSSFLHNATDADLAALKDKQTLRTLDVSRSQVTDGGLAQRVDMKDLQFLILDGPKVTDTGAAKVKAVPPDTIITR
jgi:hypothetical protein